MIPSAWPGSTVKLIASATTMAPKRFEMESTCSNGIEKSSRWFGRAAWKTIDVQFTEGSGQRLQFVRHRNFRRVLIVHNDHIVGELLARPPLTAHQRCAADILHRLSRPAHRSD